MENLIQTLMDTNLELFIMLLEQNDLSLDNFMTLFEEYKNYHSITSENQLKDILNMIRDDYKNLTTTELRCWFIYREDEFYTWLVIIDMIPKIKEFN